MKIVAKTSYSDKSEEVDHAFFDLENLLDVNLTTSNETMLFRVSIRDNQLLVVVTEESKRLIEATYHNVETLQNRIKAHLLNVSMSGLLPPNFVDSDYDNAEIVVDEQENTMNQNTKLESIVIAESSTIAKVEYDNLLNRMLVTFKSGSTYQYVEVPHKVFDELVSAESAGKYFAANIKGKYEFLKKG